MGIVRIVTDSSAELAPELADELDITVIPWRLHWGNETVLDDASFRSPKYYRDAIRRKALPTALAPTTDQFEQTYQRLCRETDGIVSIHASAQLAPVVNTAQRVRRGLVGRCDLQVVDSQFISCALGMLVVEAAKAAQAGLDPLTITRLVHGLIPSMYMAFYLDNLEFLQRRGLTLDLTNVKGGGVAGFKPLLLVENGEIVVLQRSRNRGTAVERLIDFLVEFDDLERFELIHTGLDRDSKELLDQLGEQVPHLAIHEHIYGPVLWSYLGPTALGVVVRYDA